MTLPKLHFIFSFKHFPRIIYGLLNFTESKSIYASDEGVVVPHSVYSDILHAEIEQFIESLFENSCVDIYYILIKVKETWIN